MIDNVKVLLISGKAGVGKSTMAKHIASEAFGKVDTELFPFAYSIKQVATEVFGWNGKKDGAGRELLQQLGQIGRKYNASIWAEATTHRMHNMPISAIHPTLYLVDDWRFPNEYLHVGAYFTTHTMRITARSRQTLQGPQAVEVSETSLDNWANNEFDFTFDNENSLSNLEHTAKVVLSYLYPEIWVPESVHLEGLGYATSE
jgi:DNA polymerase III delta prime subunit